MQGSKLFQAFGEFEAAGESIPTNILADRLRRLEDQGLVRKEAYQNRPVRYKYILSEKGAALEPVLREMIRWGIDHVEGTGHPS